MTALAMDNEVDEPFAVVDDLGGVPSLPSPFVDWPENSFGAVELIPGDRPDRPGNESWYVVTDFHDPVVAIQGKPTVPATGEASCHGDVSPLRMALSIGATTLCGCEPFVKTRTM